MAGKVKRGQVQEEREESKSTILTEDMIQNVHKGCSLSGWGNKEVAEFLGVCTGTVLKWRRKFKEFREAMQAGQDEHAVKLAEGKALTLMTGYHDTSSTVTTYYDADGQVKNSQVTERNEYVPPDAKLLKWFLQNRSPDRWNNNQRIMVDGRVEHKHLSETTEILKNLPTEKLTEMQKMLEEAREDIIDAEYKEVE